MRIGRWAPSLGRVVLLLATIERLHKVWHYASAVKVGHFEWLTMYTVVMGQKRAKPVSVKQATIP